MGVRSDMGGTLGAIRSNPFIFTDGDQGWRWHHLGLEGQLHGSQLTVCVTPLTACSPTWDSQSGAGQVFIHLLHFLRSLWKPVLGGLA